MPHGEKFSYMTVIPVETLSQGGSLTENTLPFPSGNVTYTRSARLDGQSLYFNTPEEGANRTHSPDDHRGAAFRVDLGQAECLTPDMPKEVLASAGTFDDKVKVSWSSGTGADTFEIWRSNVPDYATATKVGESASSPYDDTTAVKGLMYFYWVRGKNSCGTGQSGGSDIGYLKMPNLWIITSISQSNRKLLASMIRR